MSAYLGSTASVFLVQNMYLWPLFYIKKVMIKLLLEPVIKKRIVVRTDYWSAARLCVVVSVYQALVGLFV